MDELVTDLARRADSKYYGKYRGIVADNQDPEQRGRLTLRIPTVLGDQETGWALPCLPFGGTAGLGWFAVPAVDAQVWVEFEAGDPRSPIWTGTFWQKSGDAPPDAQKTPPTTRLLQTAAAGHILQLDDEPGKQRIRLHHAGGAELVIDDSGSITLTDQAGNAVTLDARGPQIAIADTQNNAITMSASGVTIQDRNANAIELAASGVTIRSTGQIVLEGTAVLLGGAGGEPVLKGQSFLSLFQSHVHTSAPTGGPTSPPQPPGQGATTLSTAVKTT